MIYFGWILLSLAALTCALAILTRLLDRKKSIAQYEAGAARESYPRRVLVAFDQFCNVLAGGDPDETISARAARWAARGKRGFILWRLVARALARWLDFIQPGHDVGARAGDLDRAETAPMPSRIRGGPYCQNRTVERLEDASLGLKGDD
ncbi:MAG TPA: hypothetical protein VNJ52_13595 [Patescibacteria group bacterium]|nr:hypothetical protein [Patescibacteria group bacterium]